MQNVLLVSGMVGMLAGVTVLSLVTRAGGTPAERRPAPRERVAADPSASASS
jgi:hypothetical protein